MSDVLVLATVFALPAFGFGALAIAMDRHWRDLTGSRAGPSRRVAAGLRAAGAVGAVAALAIAVWNDGASFGITLWVLAMSAGAGVAAAAVWAAAAARRSRRG